MKTFWLRVRDKLTPGRLVAFVVGLVGFISAVLGIWQVPFVHDFFAGPGQMDCGELKIAIAEFGVQEDAGAVERSKDAYALANSVYQFLDSELGPCEEGGAASNYELKVQVWPPSRTGLIKGETREQRAEAAERLAGKINADVVLYGNIHSGTATTTLLPEFYLAAHVVDQVADLAGQYELGEPLGGPGSFGSPVAQLQLREQLEARSPALAQFVIGLSYLAVNQAEKALEHFQAAAQSGGWQDEQGKELVYQFLGNTALQMNDLDGADGYFKQALALDPEYARAQLGVALVIFQRARSACTREQVDETAIRAAMAGFDRALHARHQPARSDIAIKARYLNSRAALCLSLAGVEDDWAQAQQGFRGVIADYERGNARVKAMAAESHAFLGLLAWQQPSTGQDAGASAQQAIQEYKQAIELSRLPERQALFYSMIGQLYNQTQDCEQADKAFATAAELDPQQAQTYEEWSRAHPCSPSGS